MDAHVPPSIRQDFIFHAMEVFGGGRRGIWKDIWPREDRMDFLKEIACLPLVHDLPIALSVVESGSLTMDSEALEALKAKKTRLETFEHVIAFAHCVERADLFLRRALKGNEIGIVVAEDVADKRRAIAATAFAYRKQSVTVDTNDKDQRFIWRHPKAPDEKQTLEIAHIIDVPHFVKKEDAPMLQIADAMAFSFRRLLSGGDRSEELIYAILGPLNGKAFIENEVWRSGFSSTVFVPARYAGSEFQVRKT